MTIWWSFFLKKKAAFSTTLKKDSVPEVEQDLEEYIFANLIYWWTVFFIKYLTMQNTPPTFCTAIRTDYMVETKQGRKLEV